MTVKMIRDPIYGYIELEEDFINIVNSPQFQRLRRICQSSYSPLYPSAFHNRFTHSLGVFHLGKIAFKSFKKDIEENFKLLGLSEKDVNKVEENEKIFLKACLLHDIGHAPFSHIGEIFYLLPDKNFISRELDMAVSKKEFKSPNEIHKREMAAPHEIVSATMGIKCFGEGWKPLEKEFFARCITGYKYKLDSVKNCLISLLKSSTIDVDRIDYLIRDSYVTGFSNFPIDYERLLKNITVIKDGGEIKLAYKKNAMGVLENVVYARDSEKKWIQTHPTILYENYIIKRAIQLMNSSYNPSNEKHIICYDSLTTEGSPCENGCELRMFSDDDIIHAMKYTKGVRDDELVTEYFERGKRRRPVWKSEFEYNANISSYFTNLGTEISSIVKPLLDDDAELGIATINDDALSKMKIYVESKKLDEDEDIIGIVKNLKKSIYFLEFFKSKLEEIKEKLDVIFIKADSFASGFSSSDLGQILIKFKTIGAPLPLVKVMTMLKPAETISEGNPFYPFWKSEKDNKAGFLKAFKESVEHVKNNYRES